MQAWEMKPEEIREKIDNMVWSFSRLQAFNSCRYAWYLQYLEEQESMENAYAQFGTLCHKTIEKFLKGELDMFSAGQYYKDHYTEEVTCDFPNNKYVDLNEKMYMQGQEYFDNIMFDFDKYEVLGVEKELLFNLGAYKFKGYADAVFRDKETGEVILCDQKTTSFKYLKNGDVSSTNKEHFHEFVLQEYLYCQPLIEEYGKVDWLTWNMIRDKKIIKIPFSQQNYLEAQAWAINTITEIENELLWLPDTTQSYRCSVICNHRDKCMYRQGGFHE